MSNVFREALIREDIISGSDLADAMESPAVIFFFAGPRVDLPYAELWSWDGDGNRTVSKHEAKYRNMTLPAMRKKTVAEAQQEAQDRLHIFEWAKSPFDNCWLPQSVLSEARERYMGVDQKG